VGAPSLWLGPLLALAAAVAGATSYWWDPPSALAAVVVALGLTGGGRGGTQPLAGYALGLSGGGCGGTQPLAGSALGLSGGGGGPAVGAVLAGGAQLADRAAAAAKRLSLGVHRSHAVFTCTCAWKCSARTVGAPCSQARCCRVPTNLAQQRASATQVPP
jgi:hypothetical protein